MCCQSTERKSAASTHLSILRLSRNNGKHSAPGANSKEGQEINLTFEREVAARKPPNDLRHQQYSMNKRSSFFKCWKTFFEGSVVKVIMFSKAKLSSEARPLSQTAKAPFVILHQERSSQRSPDGGTIDSPMLIPYMSLILCL
jgi:hypothetical protein